MAASFARALALILALAAPLWGLAAQESSPLCLASQRAAAAAAGESESGPKGGPVDIITPHITDSHQLDAPYYKSPFVCCIELPRWAPVHIGSLTLDLSPTKHVVWLIIAS